MQDVGEGEVHVDETLPKMNLFDAILHRRTCKSFTQEPVEIEKIAQIIQAGMEAPSSGNLQNWQFIIITDKNKLRELYHHTLEQESFNSAAIGIIVCCNEDIMQKYYGLRGKRLYGVQNCAACIQNMLLAAHAFSLGACWVGAFDEEKVDSMFNIPETVRAQAILLFGYPADLPEEKEKKDISYLTFFNEYGEKVEKMHLVLRDYSSEWEQQINFFKTKAKEVIKRSRGPLNEKSKEVTKQTKEQAKKFLKTAKTKLDSAYESLKKDE